MIAERLELAGALGTVAESRDGVFTGHLVGSVLHGQAKAAAVKGLVRERGYDLARCTAHSDSINDVPMLSLVGRAVAVNPDSALRAEARARGWEIRDFRTGRTALRVGLPGTAAVTLGAAALGRVPTAAPAPLTRVSAHSEPRYPYHPGPGADRPGRGGGRRRHGDNEWTGQPG